VALGAVLSSKIVAVVKFAAWARAWKRSTRKALAFEFVVVGREGEENL
jgi:hypothetical protein